MSIATTYCPISQQTVVKIVDLEGRAVRVICTEYEASGDCRLKTQTARGGPLSRLLERVSEGTLDRRSTTCDLA